MAPGTPPKVARPANLDSDQMRSAIGRLSRTIEALDQFDPESVNQRFAPEVKTLENKIEENLERAFGPDTTELIRYSSAAILDNGPIVMSMHSRRPQVDFQRYLREGKAKSLLILRGAVSGLEEEVSLAPAIVASTPARSHDAGPASRKVFVVHGHDEAALQTLARFLERIGLVAIVLREQPNQGRTIIEKFEDNATEVGFAVVLLTPDDLASTATVAGSFARARQNVIFELGYFAGKLGRGKVCLLQKGTVEIPSDLYGVIYTDMDPAEGWIVSLIKELKGAGLEFDANRAWS